MWFKFRDVLLWEKSASPQLCCKLGHWSPSWLLRLLISFSDGSQAGDDADFHPISSPERAPEVERGPTEDDEWEDIEETEVIGGGGDDEWKAKIPAEHFSRKATHFYEMRNLSLYTLFTLRGSAASNNALAFYVTLSLFFLSTFLWLLLSSVYRQSWIPCVKIFQLQFFKWKY